MYPRATSDTARLADLGQRIRARREKEGLSLRAASAEIGISFNTLGRVERGHLPDLENFQRIARWLGEASEIEEVTAEVSTPETIATHLRTDPLLSTAAADQISGIVRQLYEALARPPQNTPVHLRAAKTFTPDAANRLGEILERMQRRLMEEV